MAQWLKFVNQGGFPAIKAIEVTTNTATTTFSFNDHPYRQTNRFYGGFFVNIPMDTSNITTTNAVKFDTKGIGGSSVDVYLPNGQIATVADIASSGPAILLCFYDRDNNRVQLM